jgi:bifunctional non-homologous end joining protein LigD
LLNRESSAGARWIHEINFRRLPDCAHRQHTDVRVYTRRGNEGHIGAGSANHRWQIVVPAADGTTLG